MCPRCGGSGLVSIPNRTIDCTDCDKSGHLKCPGCKGKGSVKA